MKITMRLAKFNTPGSFDLEIKRDILNQGDILFEIFDNGLTASGRCSEVEFKFAAKLLAA